MKKAAVFFGRASVCVVLLATLTQCGTLSSLANALTSAECDDFLQNELTSSLADECRDLTDYLDAESDSLDTMSQALPVFDLGETGETFLQLTDANGDPLTDIDASDVTVAVSTDGGDTYEEVDGVTLTPLSEVETTQTSILAVVDYSASILDDDLEEVVNGMNIFLQYLDVGYTGGLVRFSTDVDLAQDFTEDEDLLLTAINDTSYTRESTSLYDAIYEGVEDLSAQTDTPLRLMLLFTDGIDNDSDHSLDEAIAFAQDNSIPVCVVGVTFADTSTLQRIASDTGCFYIYRQLFTSLDDAFQSFANQINNFQMVDLPDDFAATDGILRFTVDAGEGTVREFTREF